MVWPLLLLGLGIAAAASGGQSESKFVIVDVPLPPPQPNTEPVDSGPSGGGSKPNTSFCPINKYECGAGDNELCCPRRWPGNWVHLEIVVPYNQAGELVLGEDAEAFIETWGSPIPGDGTRSGADKFNSNYTMGENYLLNTIATAYGVHELWQKKPSNWSDRALGIFAAVVNHPRNVAQLRSSNPVRFVYKAKGWTIEGVHVPGGWHPLPMTVQEAQENVNSYPGKYPTIWLPSP